MNERLAGVNAKLARAKEHLDEIAQTMRRFDHLRCDIVPEESADGDLIVLVVRLSPQPPVQLSAMIGDCLFNIRSALDHLAWQLTASPTQQTMFPICTTVDNFAQQVKRKRLDGMSDKAKALIEALQPFEAPMHPIWQPDYPAAFANPLGLLSTLHDIDKHRAFNLVTLAALDTAIQAEGVGFGSFIGNEVLRDGAIFGGIGIPKTMVRRNWREEMQMHGEARAFVAFGDLAGDDEELEKFKINTVLDEILKFIWYEVIPGLEPLVIGTANTAGSRHPQNI